MTGHNSYEITTLSDPAAIATLEPEWDVLAERTGIPFLRLDWLTAWCTAFGAGRLLIYAARRDGDLVAVLPLVAKDSTLRSPTNAHTPVFLPLGGRAAVSTLAASALTSGVGSLIVSHLPSDDPLFEALAESSQRAGRLTWREAGQISPIVDTSGDLERYRHDLDRHTRRELGRLRRKLEAERKGTQIRPLAHPVDLQQELQAALELEARGWKGHRRTAILCRADTASFYRMVAADLARRGELRLSTISADGHLIAFDLCVVAHSRAWILKGAYDERYRRYAPGLILLLAEIEHAFELGLQAVELLGGADDYKRKFATDFRPHGALHSYRRLPVPLARLTYHRAARPILRRAYRALRPR